MESAPHPATLADDDLLAGCDRVQLRRGGPGGQHRNKVSTAVRLTHRATGIRAEASERRSARSNGSMALHRLRLRLACDTRAAWAEPSPRWRGRVSGGRIVVATDHPEFPMLLAEALDALDGLGGDLPAAADALGVSTSQLDKLLRRHRLAFDRARAMTQRAESPSTRLSKPPGAEGSG